MLRIIPSWTVVLVYVGIIGAVVTLEGNLRQQPPGGQHAGGVRVRKNETSWFDPQHQPPVSYHDEEVEITLVVQGGQLSLSVNKKDMPAERINLPEEVAQVNEIRRVQGSRAVILGMNNGDLFDVTVVDLQPLRISDKFFCYFPTLSPDGRYIVFVKFFVTHPGNTPVEAHYMLYDTGKSALQNRPPGTSIQDWMTVGITMYPVGIGNKPLDNYGKENHIAACSRFFWNPYTESVLFADRSHKVLSLILVNLDVATDNFRVGAANISLEQMCNSKGRLGQRSDCLVNLVKAEFDKASNGGISVVIKGVGIDAWLGEQAYKFKYTEFK